MFKFTFFIVIVMFNFLNILKLFIDIRKFQVFFSLIVDKTFSLIRIIILKDVIQCSL